MTKENKMKHVVVYRKLQKVHLDFLRDHCKVSYFPNITKDNQKQFLADLRTADGLFGAGMTISSDLLNNVNELSVVSNFSAGYDNLDLKELTERGIIATNVPDILTDTTADLIFTLMLSVARRVPEFDSYIRKKKWVKVIEEEKDLGINVHHKTIGIIGLGRIGRAVAKRAALGFDMKVLYHKRTRDLESEEDLGAVYCEDLDELLQKSNFVCITVSLSDETRNLISDREFKQMKPSGILINGSRGAVVNESALIEALKQCEIRGAGLDVFEKEPLDVNSDLMSLENAVLTPHLGSATIETRSLMVEHGIKNLLAGLKGEKPVNILNEEVIAKNR